MLLFLIASLCIALTSGKHVVDQEYMFLEEDSEGLVWPEQYTIKILKTSLISDLTEEISIWRTNTSGRVDYNKGAVIGVVILGDEPEEGSGDDDDDKPNNYIYAIHPETKDSIVSSLVCFDFSGHRATLPDILPKVQKDKIKIIGNETIIDVETVKFESIETEDFETTKKIIWATIEYTEDESVWVPVKYEVTEYNDILGSVMTHEVWYFSDFSTEVDESVFDVQEFNCSKFNPEPPSELVTKELMAIDPDVDEHVDHIFNHFKTKYERQYADEREHALRRSIFKQNMRLISSINRKNLSYKLGVNQFADKTIEEVRQKHTGLLRRPEGKVGNIPFPYSEDKLKSIVEELPEEHDLRLLGLVSAVKDQANCGSCWTYSTTSAAEGALARSNGGRLLSLSNQALIDCAWGYGAYGCLGGFDTSAYEWMMKFGLPTVEEYGPYKNKEDFCHVANLTRYPIKGYVDVTSFSESALKVAVVNHGPLSVAIEVSQKFSLYSRGVFYDNECGPTMLSHALTLVGYGVQDGELFWVLKNSWGTQWGEAGYMQISARDNDCGVATKATYVLY